jgi:antitoxin HigA-1
MDGIAVKAVRLAAKLSQGDFSEQLGISQSLLSMVENGKRPVSDRIRIRIAQAFGIGEETIEAIRRAKLSDRLIV